MHHISSSLFKTKFFKFIFTVVLWFMRNTRKKKRKLSVSGFLKRSEIDKFF